MRPVNTVFVLFAVAVICAATHAAPLALSDVLTTMEKVNNHFIATDPKPDCGWTRGTYFTGNMAHYLASKDQKYLDYATQEGKRFNWTVCNYPKTISEHAAANDYCISQTYAQLYQIDPKSEYMANTESFLMDLVNRAQVDDFWWIDAFFMGLPTFAITANITGNTQYSEKMFALYNDTTVRLGLWSAEHNLYYRDATYFNQTCPNGEPIFWARGNGWAFAALTRVLNWLPASDPHRDDYVGRYKAIAAKLVSIQNQTDGFWRVSLLDFTQYPGPETTGTSMFTYGLAWGINNGILDKATYLPATQKAWNGLNTIAVQPDGFLGYCQPVGASPKPVVLNSTSDFCVGQFLLAASEINKFP